MDILGNINIISIVIACFFIIPILSGILRPFSSGRMQNSILSLFNNLELLISVILSIHLTSLLLANSNNFFLTALNNMIPAFQNMISGKEIWVYAIFFLLFLFIIDGLLHLLTIPVYKYALVPVSNKISSAFNKMSSIGKRIISGLWQLPKSIWLVLVLSILIYFFSSVNINSPLAASIAEYANTSASYQLIEENVIQPLLNSSVVQNIQVLLNDSFKQAVNEISGETRNKQLVKYFNGVTLDVAVKSNSEIDTIAQKVAGSQTNDKQKATLIYKWISKNIKYDFGKAATIAKDPSKVSSGAIVAFNTRTGVCFDYSTLYVAMCRAVGLKVRFITGLGFSGTSWGDHAWNQVYDPKENAWINVDTTFGSSGINYFDKPNFDSDHTHAEIQGEW